MPQEAAFIYPRGEKSGLVLERDSHLNPIFSGIPIPENAAFAPAIPDGSEIASDEEHQAPAWYVFSVGGYRSVPRPSGSGPVRRRHSELDG